MRDPAVVAHGYPAPKLMTGVVLFVMVTAGALAFSVVQPELAELRRVEAACAVPKHKRTPDQAQLCSPGPAPLGFIISGVL